MTVVDAPVAECPDLACTRRRLLTAGAAVAGLAALDVASPRMAFASTRQRGDLLVVITLEGGADGLSLVPPLADAHYASARPDIAVRPNQAIHLDRSFGLHPGLAPLLPLWKKHQLAVVHAVGDSDGTRSHFEATDAMERGVNVTSTVGTGWIDRYLSARGLQSGAFPALAVGDRPAGALAGGAPSLVTSDVSHLGIQVGPSHQAATELALAQMYAGLSGPVGAAARDTLGAVRRFSRFRDKPYQPRAGVTYPSDGLGGSLAQVAQVARAGVGLEVACVSAPGWDTHQGMGGAAGGYMSGLVSRLGLAIAAFAKDLGPLMATTTIVTMSEFGRRVNQNGSNGVDHGHGSAMLVLGGGIRGGRVYGRWPGLAPAQLEDGDLRVTSDYRDVLGEIVHRRLGGRALNEVFPDHRPRELGLAKQR
ncbi:MAG: hypothetical protein JWM40_2155 [Frankiales bacterium]|nr:hypothetical protein [Frankiales bacterium]